MPRQDEAAANSADLSADVVIPGPQGSTVLKNILLNRNDDGVRRLVQMHQSYGDLVHLQIANRHIYLIFHPDDVQRVLQMNNRNYVKGELLDKLRVAAGNGLFTSEGDFWRRQRRMRALPAASSDGDCEQQGYCPGPKSGSSVPHAPTLQGRHPSANVHG